MGYHRAGFEVVGVDIKPQPRYPFAFVQADVMQLDQRFLRWFDAIHASPPCQGYTDLRHAPGAKGAPRLIGAVRENLRQTGLPYVIENVTGAKSEMLAPVLMCGSMFGLEATYIGETLGNLQRHRLFECNFLVEQRDCRHRQQEPVIGVYGGHARLRSKAFGGRDTRDSWPLGHKHAASQAMGIDWMTLAELSEAIPPAYTEFIGRQLLAHIQSRREAA